MSSISILTTQLGCYGRFAPLVQSAKLLRMTADPMRQFGEHLRAMRKARGLSQNELAERADVNDKYLGEIERGDGNPSLEVLQRLAKALGIDLTTLIGDEVVRLGRGDLRAEVNRHVDALTDDQLRDLVRMFRLRAP